MKPKIAAIIAVVIMLFAAPVIATILWIGLALLVGIAIWNKDKLLSAKDEIKEVLNGEHSRHDVD